MVNACTHWSNEDLRIQIEEKRTELINLAEKNGLTSYHVLKCSMELDQLINEIQAFTVRDKNLEFTFLEQ